MRDSTESDATGNALQAPSSTDRQVLEILMNFSTSATGPEPSSRPDQTTSRPQDQACEDSGRTRVEPSAPLLDAHDHGLPGRDRAQPVASGRLRRTSTHRMDESVSNPLGLLADASGEAQDGVLQDPPSSAAPTDEGHTALDTRSQGRVSSAADTRTYIPSNTHENTGIASIQVADQGTAHTILNRPGYVSLGLKMDRGILESALDNLIRSPSGRAGRYTSYFAPKEQKSAPDTGPDLDPVDLGLVTMDEAENLFPM